MSPTPKSSSLLKVIVFAIADYQLALPMKAVFKITPCPPQVSLNVDLLDLDGQAIQLLDLTRQLTPQNSLAQRQFLLLLQMQDQLLGIPLAELPNMTTLSMQTIQVLPATAQATPLGQVCRYVSLPSHDSDQAALVFLLDLGLVLPQQRDGSTPSRT